MTIAQFGVRASTVAALLSTATLLAAASPVLALDEPANEKDMLKACQKQLCDIATKKEASGSDLACALSKTWSKARIQEGVEKKKLSWGFGDARCTMDVKVKRGAIIDAVSKPDGALEFDPHSVKCQIEYKEEVTTINISLAPKITFKDGKAQKTWLNIKEIEAPTVIKGALWTVAQAEDKLGLFHSEMIAEINELLGQRCAKVEAGN